MCWCCSIFYVCATCCDLDVTIRRRAWQKLRGNDNSPSHVPPKRKEAIKSGISGCGSIVVPYFQPATSIDLYIWRWQAWLEVGKLNSIRPTGNEPLMVTAIEVKGKEHNGQPDEQEKELHRGGSVPGLHTTQVLTRRMCTSWSRLFPRSVLAPQLRSDWLQSTLWNCYHRCWLDVFLWLAQCSVMCEIWLVVWLSCIWELGERPTGGQYHKVQNWLDPVFYIPACGIAWVNDVPFDWIWVCWFHTVHNEM